jgi:phosphoserine/homoserine phosphotransferase
MNIVCLDMEGVLVPEIWLAVAEKTGIEALKRTTRDEPNYDKLMAGRLAALEEAGITLADIQDVIATMEPLEGAREFLDKLRKETQVIVLTDSFEEFAMPLLAKLNYPTAFCNGLEVDERGMIVRHVMRVVPSKLTTVRALQTMGYDTIAAGDSLNDLGMIRASKAGFLFKSTEGIIAANPDVPAYEDYDELLAAIEAAL